MRSSSFNDHDVETGSFGEDRIYELEFQLYHYFNERIMQQRGEEEVKIVITNSEQDNERKPIFQPFETGNSSDINFEEDMTTGDEAPGGRSTCWTQKVDLEWMFIITNIILELPSAVFDQLSSVYKPQYALVGMLISFAAILLCITELNYNLRKERVNWRWKGTLPWFYHPSESHKPFGSFKDIFGLGCALCQSIVTTINYVFHVQSVDNPIKISVWPIIFAFGLLCSKLAGNPQRRAIA